MDKTPQEHRVVEANVLSNNRIGHHNVVIVAVIPVLIFSAIAAIAIWPFLPTIGEALMWLAVIAAICLALVITAAAIYACYRFRLHLQHIDRQNRLLQWEHNAGWDEGSRLRNLTVEIIEAGKPPQIAANVVEMTEQDRIDVERSKVLTLRQQGMGLHAIEKALDVPYNRVRDYCNTMEELQAKARQRNQMDA